MVKSRTVEPFKTARALKATKPKATNKAAKAPDSTRSASRISRWFHNGGRLVLASWVVALIALALAATALITTLLQDGRYKPLGEYSQIKILSTVQGIDGPAVLETEPFSFSVTKCMADGYDETLATSITNEYTTVEEPRLTRLGLTFPTTRQPGCTNLLLQHPPPRERGLLPGYHWRIWSTETATEPGGDRSQSVTAVSEPFLVEVVDGNR